MNGRATAGAAPVQNWIGDETRVSDQQNAELLGVSVVLDLFVPPRGVPYAIFPGVKHPGSARSAGSMEPRTSASATTLRWAKAR
jgi:hypothetical protein